MYRRIGFRFKSAICGYMAWIALAGLLTNAVLHKSWADPIAALALLPLIVMEGWEAIFDGENPWVKDHENPQSILISGTLMAKITNRIEIIAETLAENFLTLRNTSTPIKSVAKTTDFNPKGC